MAFETYHLLDICTHSCHENSKSVSGIQFKMRHPHIYRIIVKKKESQKLVRLHAYDTSFIANLFFVQSQSSVCV